MAQLCAGAMYTDSLLPVPWRRHRRARRRGGTATGRHQGCGLREGPADHRGRGRAFALVQRDGRVAAALEAGSVIERTRSFLSTGEVGHLVGPDSPQVHKVTMRASAGSRAVTHSGRKLLPHRKPMIRSGCHAGTLRTICYATALCFFKEEFLRYKETSEHN